ncbi:MAG TPA: marine proteobacterial sortase target protein [Burkholderiales bacterium]
MKLFWNRNLIGVEAPEFSMVRDVIRFVVTAAIAGTGFAILLALTILGLTLVAPPAEASSAPEAGSAQGSPSDRPGDQTSGSFLMRVRPGGEYVRSPVLSTDVRFAVSGTVARAVVSQQFRNDSPDWVEGIYVFPLPENAAVDRLRMQVGDRLIEGQIRERVQARAEYEAARERGSLASLIEQERPNIFTSSVANLGPGQTLTVVIEYQQALRYQDGSVSLRFPTVVAPRYIPGTPQSEGKPAGHGWAADTDKVRDASRITPKVLAEDEPLRNPVTIHVELDAGFPVNEVKSRYHPVKVQKRDDNRYEVSLAVGPFPADRDFELVWNPLPGAQPRGALFLESAAGETHLLLTLFPPFGVKADEKRLPREVIYVIDTSGSMEGTSITQAKSALGLALGQLAPEDRFNVIQFNSATELLFPSSREASVRNLVAARRYVDKLRATGGTEMVPAMQAALESPSKEGYLRQVVFMTDGSVGNEDQLFKLIQRKLDRSRLFTVGIGSAPNGHFMTKAAQLGRGSFTYIGDVGEVGEKMAELFGKLEHPVLSDIAVEWPAELNAQSSPEKLPDLYLGEPIVLSALVEGPLTGKVKIAGRAGGEAWTAEFDLSNAHAGKGMGVIWARRKVEALMDSIQEGADREEVRQQVVGIALKHHIVTRYTSLVAVEVTQARPQGEPLDSEAVPVNLPDGGSHAGYFGSLPKTATPATLHLILALLAAAVAFVALMARRVS